MATRHSASTKMEIWDDEYVRRVTYGPPYTDNEEMKYGLLRLTSFDRWPKHAPEMATSLSRAGFFYTGKNDIVKCYACGGMLGSWQQGVDPEARHVEAFPDCIICRVTTALSDSDVSSPDGVTSCDDVTTTAANITKAFPSGEDRSGTSDSDEGYTSEAGSAGCPASPSGDTQTVPTEISPSSKPSDNLLTMPLRSMVDQSKGNPIHKLKLTRKRDDDCISQSQVSCSGPSTDVTAPSLSGSPSDDIPELPQASSEDQSNRDPNLNGNLSPLNSGASANPSTCCNGDWAHNLEPIGGEPDKDYLRAEKYRLRTFLSGWPASCPVTPPELARDGFWYLWGGKSDSVECVFCGIIFNSWQGSHVGQVRVTHGKHSPKCAFILGRDVQNLKYEPTVNGPESEDAVANVVEVNAKHIEYANAKARLATFGFWPKNSRMDKNALVAAGFFSVGCGDKVKCFCCNIGLENWSLGDDAWQEHAKQSPFCDFIRLAAPEQKLKQVLEPSRMYMETPEVRQAQAMGHSTYDIRHVIQAKLHDHQRPPRSAQAIVDAIKARQTTGNSTVVADDSSVVVADNSPVVAADDSPVVVADDSPIVVADDSPVNADFTPTSSNRVTSDGATTTVTTQKTAKSRRQKKNQRNKSRAAPLEKTRMEEKVKGV